MESVSLPHSVSRDRSAVRSRGTGILLPDGFLKGILPMSTLSRIVLIYAILLTCLLILLQGIYKDDED